MGIRQGTSGMAEREISMNKPKELTAMLFFVLCAVALFSFIIGALFGIFRTKYFYKDLLQESHSTIAFLVKETEINTNTINGLLIKLEDANKKIVSIIYYEGYKKKGKINLGDEK